MLDLLEPQLTLQSMHLIVFTTMFKLECFVVFFAQYLDIEYVQNCCVNIWTLAGPNHASIWVWLYRDFVNSIMLYPTPAFCQMMELWTVWEPGFSNALEIPKSSRRLKHVEIRYCSLAAVSALLYCRLCKANGSLNELFGACCRSSKISTYGLAQYHCTSSLVWKRGLND